MSVYRIAIVREDGYEVVLRPGRQGEERDFIQAIWARMQAQGVGAFKSEARVRAALEHAFNEVVSGLKQAVRP